MSFSGYCHPSLQASDREGNVRVLSGLNQAGNTLLQVTIIIAVLSLGVYFLSDRLVRQKNVVLNTNTVMRVHFGLQSIVDYTYYLVERRYCITDNLLQAPNCQLDAALPAGAKTASFDDIGSARSIERILLSDQQAANMVEMVNKDCVDLNLEAPYKPQKHDPSLPIGPKNCQDGTINDSFQQHVRTIEILLPAKNVTATHPLFAVIDPLNHAMKSDLEDKATGQKFELNIRVTIQRDTSVTVPKSGSEVYFTVKVRLEDQFGKLLAINNKQIPLEVASYGTMFPRELGAFSLMVPHDLRLDGPEVIPGDFSVAPVQNWAGGVGSGMLFKSPVFINGDVHLPLVDPANGGHYSGASKAYSPVTFADRVILGSGIIYDGPDHPYRPETAGGKNDTYWTDNRLFGGFKMGVAVDNAMDKGLSQFASLSVVGADYSQMQKCLDRSNATTNSAAIKDAALYAVPISPAVPGPSSSFDYILGDVDPAKSAPGDLYAILFNPQNKPLGPVTSGAGNPFVTTPPAISGSPINGAVMKLVVKLGAQEADAYLAPGNTLTLTTDALSLTSSAHVTLKTAALAETDVSGPAHAALTAYEAAIPNQGTLTFSVSNVTLPATTYPQLHLLKLHLAVTHPESMYDDTTAHLAQPVVEVLGFDARFQNNAPASADPIIATSADAHMRRTFEFSNDGTALSSPAAIKGPGYAPAPGLPLVAYPNPYDGRTPAYDAFDYVDLQKTCDDNANRGNGQSFGAAAWNIDFAGDAKSVRKSWNFANGIGINRMATQDPNHPPHQEVGEKYCDNVAPYEHPVPTDPTATGYDLPHYAMCSLALNGNNSVIGPPQGNPILWSGVGPAAVPINRDEFAPKSIVKDCTIASDAMLVAGFFVCENLTIAARSKHLYMIGTFVVKNLFYDPSVLKHGVDWMSIYHPDAVTILRNSGVLHPHSNPQTACDDHVTGRPIWDNVSPTTSAKQDRSSCNSLILRDTAQPFQWTAFDPDCGILPNQNTATNTVCKHHPVNYFVMEQGRGGGP